jgi:O-antigen ligase
VWANGLELFAQNPWTGTGLHDLRDDYLRVKAPEDPVEGHMHSVTVQIAASMGVPGLLAFGWLIVTAFRELSRAQAGTRRGELPRAVVDGAEAGLVAFLSAGIVEWNLGDSEILALLFFQLGTAIAAGRLEEERAS